MPEVKKLIALINDADINDPELIECVGEIEKKLSIKPSVGFPSIKEFNESVKFDLNDYKGGKNFHFIEQTTRLSAVALVKFKKKKKKKENYKVFKHCVSLFGCPQKFLIIEGNLTIPSSERDENPVDYYCGRKSMILI